MTPRPCAHCGSAVRGPHVHFGDEPLHNACAEDFMAARLGRCAHCAKALQGRFFTLAGIDGGCRVHDHCVEAFKRARRPTCSMCGAAVTEDTWLDVQGAKYHEGCAHRLGRIRIVEDDGAHDTSLHRLVPGPGNAPAAVQQQVSYTQVPVHQMPHDPAAVVHHLPYPNHHHHHHGEPVLQDQLQPGGTQIIIRGHQAAVPQLAGGGASVHAMRGGFYIADPHYAPAQQQHVASVSPSGRYVEMVGPGIPGPHAAVSPSMGVAPPHLMPPASNLSSVTSQPGPMLHSAAQPVGHGLQILPHPVLPRHGTGQQFVVTQPGGYVTHM